MVDKSSPATSTSEQQAVPVAQELREVMPGHWSTSGGLAMALATLDDPHMARSRERISDFALANEVFLSPGIANLTDAKERIRWLSASLAVALRTDATQAREAEGMLHGDESRADKLSQEIATKAVDGDPQRNGSMYAAAYYGARHALAAWSAS